MDRQSPSTSANDCIVQLARPLEISSVPPSAARFVYALRLIALHERVGRDPVPELASRLGSVDVAAKALAFTQCLTSSWPENIHVSRFCCQMLSHDEATISAVIESALDCNYEGMERTLQGLVRTDRFQRLWEAALELVGAEALAG